MHFLMRDVVVNPCLKFLPNALCRDGGEVTVGKNGVYDGRIGRLLFWGHFSMSAETNTSSTVQRKAYGTLLASATETRKKVGEVENQALGGRELGRTSLRSQKRLPKFFRHSMRLSGVCSWCWRMMSVRYGFSGQPSARAKRPQRGMPQSNWGFDSSSRTISVGA